jgi:hypothetical protein
MKIISILKVDDISDEKCDFDDGKDHHCQWRWEKTHLIFVGAV